MIATKETIKEVIEAHGKVISDLRERVEDPSDYSQKDIIKLIYEKLREYPEELTFDEFDDMPWDSAKQFGLNDNRELSEIVKDVLAFAEKTKGQIYTQVDGDEDRIYSRGMQFVNRTGLWEVVKIKGMKVDNS